METIEKSGDSYIFKEVIPEQTKERKLSEFTVRKELADLIEQAKYLTEKLIEINDKVNTIKNILR